VRLRARCGRVVETRGGCQHRSPAKAYARDLCGTCVRVWPLQKELLERFGIRFTRLFALTNMPIKRFADALHRWVGGTSQASTDSPVFPRSMWYATPPCLWLSLPVFFECMMIRCLGWVQWSRANKLEEYMGLLVRSFNPVRPAETHCQRNLHAE
jgi:hypothetical protein